MTRVSIRRRLARMAGSIAAVFLPVFIINAAAEDLPQPKGPVLLTLTGNIQKTNRDGAAVFDEEMLSALVQHRIDTTTPWTDGVKRFEGVLLIDLLRHVGTTDVRTVSATALNDYRVEFPAADATEFGVLLAMRMDGLRLTRRDKGPIWIVYPRDSIRILQDERYDHRWVWQLDRIEVR